MKRFFVIFLTFLLSVSAKLPKDTSIIIVGAGAAGITALSHLLENGYTNVTLLEASNRIGGRINTVPFAANVVDLGAQWIHGNEGNILYELVKDKKVSEVTPDEYNTGWFISSEGKKDPIYTKLFNLSWSEIYDTRECENVKPQKYGKYFMERYNKLLKYSDIETKKSMNDFVRHFEKFILIEDANDSWFDSTTSTCSHYVKLNGSQANNWKDGGYKTVFDFITRKRPNPEKQLKIQNYIKFNKEVTKIDWFKLQVSVKCKDDSTYKAQHVIVTLPLGVLKASYKKMFAPRLPAKKVNSIESINFGTANKIFLEFDKIFWDESFPGFSLIWTDEGLKKIKGTRLEWIKDVIGLYRLPYQPKVLFGFIVGPNARLMETLSENELQESIEYILKSFLKPTFNYTLPLRILVTKWNSNPYARGSYSSRITETDRRKGSAQILSTPLWNARTFAVLFAGEATHPQFYSTVHGAVESGYREANRLMRLNSNFS